MGVVDLLFLVKVFVIVLVLVFVVVVVVSVVLIDYSTIKNHEDQGGQCGSGIYIDNTLDYTTMSMLPEQDCGLVMK